eukprot:31419-Pelagococcus_subviridis.AAC.7
MRPVLRLAVDLRVEVAVVDDDDVRAREVQALTARARGQQEGEDVAAVSVERVADALALLHRGCPRRSSTARISAGGCLSILNPRVTSRACAFLTRRTPPPRGAPCARARPRAADPRTAGATRNRSDPSRAAAPWATSPRARTRPCDDTPRTSLRRPLPCTSPGRATGGSRSSEGARTTL